MSTIRNNYIGCERNRDCGPPVAVRATVRSSTGATTVARQRFNEAMTLAYEYANANPDKVREIDGQRTQLPKEFIATREIQPFEAGFDAAAWAKEAEGYAKFGFIPRIPDPSEYIWEHAPKQ